MLQRLEARFDGTDFCPGLDDLQPRRFMLAFEFRFARSGGFERFGSPVQVALRAFQLTFDERHLGVGVMQGRSCGRDVLTKCMLPL